MKKEPDPAEAQNFAYAEINLKKFTKAQLASFLTRAQLALRHVEETLKEDFEVEKQVLQDEISALENSVRMVEEERDRYKRNADHHRDQALSHQYMGEQSTEYGKVVVAELDALRQRIHLLMDLINWYEKATVNLRELIPFHTVLCPKCGLVARIEVKTADVVCPTCREELRSANLKTSD